MKKKFFLSFMIPLLFMISDGYISQSSGEDPIKKNMRNAILAGQWYPGTQSALSKLIRNYLSNVKPVTLDGELKAIIVPHAGYVYSGQVAAHAYSLLKSRNFKMVIMIGPSHRVGFRGISVNLQPGYKTPLGVVPVDRDLGKKIIHADDKIRWIPRAHAFEHSLEIQVPFLQIVLGDFQIVPILMGQQDANTCSVLVRSLMNALGNMDRTLVLASTDLSHFHDYRRAMELDHEFIKHVREFKPEGLADSLSSGRCEACGSGPALTTMSVAKALGANRAVILNYANSGDVTNDRSRVVGYLSAALIQRN
ncbi:MAG: AmmeMemoRadiSam system protein B [Thermodesulfobacteriota bacterium]|nr:AmmeMemoRadiSam system protein B [Thermodesulfobacteriota bacterium]